MSEEGVGYRPRKSANVASRLAKARKIEVLLGRYRALEGARVLEIGSGNGVITAELARAVGERGEVWGVDVVDRRQVHEGFRFRQVTGTELPFEAGSFDIVLSNHVIEHVGERADQLHHLQEIRRVLTPGGWCYLAAPNRWTPIEPHFGLPFLAWLPVGWRSPYVRLARKGAVYDCNLPARGGLSALIAQTGMVPHDCTVEAMRVMAEVESPGRAARTMLTAPAGVLRIVRPLIPAMVFLLRKPGPETAPRPG
jgi:SAM-dependent methyltransferase